MKSLRDFVKSSKVFIVAHRGASGTSPENTLAAFEEAIAHNSAMVEADIHFTLDNEIIAIHDFSHLKGFKNDISPSKFNYKDLSDIDVGSWFNPKFKNQRIPLLIDIIKLIYGRVYLNIEFKDFANQNIDSYLMNFIHLIKSNDFFDYFMVSSFDLEMLSKIKKINSSTPVAAIQNPYNKLELSKIKELTGCEGFICDINDLEYNLIEDACFNNIYLGVYNINTIEDLKKTLSYGIKAIATDYPAKIYSMLKELNINVDLP